MGVRMERYKLSNPLDHNSFQKPCTYPEETVTNYPKRIFIPLLEKRQLNLSALVDHRQQLLIGVVKIPLQCSS